MADAVPTLLVQQAETGASVSVPASESDSVGLVKSALQASLAVPVEVQILLLGDSTLLADDHTLAEYSLPSSEPSDRPVFVFDRRNTVRFGAQAMASNDAIEPIGRCKHCGAATEGFVNCVCVALSDLNACTT